MSAQKPRHRHVDHNEAARLHADLTKQSQDLTNFMEASEQKLRQLLSKSLGKANRPHGKGP